MTPACKGERDFVALIRRTRLDLIQGRPVDPDLLVDLLEWFDDREDEHEELDKLMATYPCEDELLHLQTVSDRLEDALQRLAEYEESFPKLPVDVPKNVIVLALRRPNERTNP